jgi:hypothetical protein
MAMDTTFDQAAKGLAELFNGPRKSPGPHHRYELIRGESGELEFQLDELDFFVDGLMKEKFGTPLTVPRFKLDPKTARLRYR